MTFKSDYFWQVVRTFPKELWDLSIVSFNYFSQAARGAGGALAMVLKPDRACLLNMWVFLPLRVLSILSGTIHSCFHFYSWLTLKTLLFNTSECVSRCWGALTADGGRVVYSFCYSVFLMHCFQPDKSVTVLPFHVTDAKIIWSSEKKWNKQIKFLYFRYINNTLY